MREFFAAPPNENLPPPIGSRIRSCQPSGVDLSKVWLWSSRINGTYSKYYPRFELYMKRVDCSLSGVEVSSNLSRFSIPSQYHLMRTRTIDQMRDRGTKRFGYRQRILRRGTLKSQSSAIEGDGRDSTLSFAYRCVQSALGLSGS
jgi:hypothetical protein